MNTGAVIKKDPRDILLKTPQVDVPDIFLPQYPIKIHYQNGQFSCGAHTLTHLIEIFEWLEKKSKTSLSPRYAWNKLIKETGRNPREGSSINDIVKIAKKYGVCDESLYPDKSVELSVDEYAKDETTPEMDENAQPRIVKQAYGFKWKPSVDDIRKLVYKHKAIIGLMRVDEGFWGTSFPEIKERKYGHFVTITGYDTDMIRVIDSADRNPKYRIKWVRNDEVEFFDGVIALIDLPDWQIKALTSELKLLRKVVQLYTQLIKLKYDRTKRDI